MNRLDSSSVMIGHTIFNYHSLGLQATKIAELRKNKGRAYFVPAEPQSIEARNASEWSDTGDLYC